MTPPLTSGRDGLLIPLSELIALHRELCEAETSSRRHSGGSGPRPELPGLQESRQRVEAFVPIGLQHLLRPHAPLPRPHAVHGWNALTRAERDVVRVVVRGRTNREAAAELSVSHHTVSTHLRHVFEKLAIRSRVELVRIALSYEEPDPG